MSLCSGFLETFTFTLLPWFILLRRKDLNRKKLNIHKNGTVSAVDSVENPGADTAEVPSLLNKTVFFRQVTGSDISLVVSFVFNSSDKLFKKFQ